MNPRDKAQGGAPSGLAPAAQSEGAQSGGLSRWLVQRAARRSPAALTERLEEEWLADLAAQRGALSRLRFALGCCWAMRVIARDYVASTARAANHATEHGAIVLAPARPKPVTRILGGPGQGFPNADDYYPLTSRRLGETGVATVRVCVDDRGRLVSAPTIAQSSGSANLDTAALRLARAGSGHYRSTTEDGKPVSFCYPYRIRFQLRE